MITYLSTLIMDHSNVNNLINYKNEFKYSKLRCMLISPNRIRCFYDSKIMYVFKRLMSFWFSSF